MSAPRMLHRFAADERGATAVEYGFVLPLLVLTILGAIWAGLLTFSVSSLDMAVQQAARCMAVDANTCPTSATTEAYAKAQYGGPAISPVFTASPSGCGHTVSAQANFDLGVLPSIGSVPLKVTACYP